MAALTEKYKPYLAYKHSGAEWPDEIPAHWETKRLKHVAALNPKASEVRNLAPDTEVSFVPMEAVGEYGGLDLSVTKELADVADGYTYFSGGDVLIAKITPCFENGKGSLAGDAGVAALGDAASDHAAGDRGAGQSIHRSRRGGARPSLYFLIGCATMKSTWLKFAIPFMPVLMSILLLAACASDEKVEVAEQTWECMANAGDPEIFETSMLMTFPTASNLEEAKEQFIYASSAASLEELKAGRDEACDGDAPEPTPTTTVPQQTEGPRPTVTAASGAAPTLEPTATPASRSTATYEPDRLVLVALYHATDGPNWANNENWLSGAPIGEWYASLLTRTDA